jgi:pimeloyl-ACP methyl ester carboxylesterase
VAATLALTALVRSLGLPVQAAPVEAAPAHTSLTRLRGSAIEYLSIPAGDSAGTVVFENGARADLEGWSAVISALSASSKPAASGPSKGWSVFAYDRPGIGRSEPTERARDGHQIVADLRELLQQQGLKPPYILVGHSLGGLYTQLFAREFPGEVKGMVLVDALYPGVIKKPDDFPFYTRWGKALFMSAMAAREIDAIHATGEAVNALPWSTSIPVVRLINVPKSAGAIAVDFGVVNADDATIARIRAMYPGAKTVVLDSDHQIQKANPEAVVQAIQDLLAAR